LKPTAVLRALRETLAVRCRCAFQTTACENRIQGRIVKKNDDYIRESMNRKNEVEDEACFESWHKRCKAMHETQPTSQEHSTLAHNQQQIFTNSRKSTK